MRATFGNFDLEELRQNSEGVNALGSFEGIGLIPELANAVGVPISSPPQDSELEALNIVLDTGRPGETTFGLTSSRISPLRPDQSLVLNPPTIETTLGEWVLRTGLVSMYQGTLDQLGSPDWSLHDRARIDEIMDACSITARPLHLSSQPEPPRPCHSFGKPTDILADAAAIDTVIVPVYPRRRPDGISPDSKYPLHQAYDIMRRVSDGAHVGRVIFAASTSDFIDVEGKPHSYKNTSAEYQKEVRDKLGITTEYELANGRLRAILAEAGVRDVRVLGLDNSYWARPDVEVPDDPTDEGFFREQQLRRDHEDRFRGLPDRTDITASQLVAEYGDTLRDGTTVVLASDVIPGKRLAAAIRGKLGARRGVGYDASFDQFYMTAGFYESWRPLFRPFDSYYTYDNMGGRTIYDAARLAQLIQQQI